MDEFNVAFAKHPDEIHPGDLVRLKGHVSPIMVVSKIDTVKNLALCVWMLPEQTERQCAFLRVILEKVQPHAHAAAIALTAECPQGSVPKRPRPKIVAEALPGGGVAMRVEKPGRAFTNQPGDSMLVEPKKGIQKSAA